MKGSQLSVNPEFTMLELYQAYADYHDMMEAHGRDGGWISEEVVGSLKVEYQGVTGFHSSYRRLSMVEAVEEVLGISVEGSDAQKAGRSGKRDWCRASGRCISCCSY